VDVRFHEEPTRSVQDVDKRGEESLDEPEVLCSACGARGLICNDAEAAGFSGEEGKLGTIGDDWGKFEAGFREEGVEVGEDRRETATDSRQPAS
jgi:hypothetical protein